jgi:hypothetical protein
MLKPKHRLIFALLLSASMALAASVMAQSDVKTVPEAQTASDSASKSAKPKTQKSTKRKTPDVFVPTEEISEDQPVAFPIDI